MFIFFFKQKTAYDVRISDWSSDVCSSDLHGSRKPGAMLYKAGMAVAQKHTALVAPEVGSHNAWIDADTREGEDYWEALQVIREWTKASHFAIHDLVAGAVGAPIRDRF